AINFLHSIYFTYLHVFPYSKRPGTIAAEFSNQIPKAIKEERVAELRKLSDSRKKLFYTGQLNRIRPVVIEGKRNKAGFLKGFTDNYVAVCFQGEDSLLDQVARVRLVSLNNDTVTGEHVENHES
ncbi:MAG: tRNA (N(6)-L-threonylcarbamoyladenosine(37)-C(2))-methylthiotransferase MtaB, partial [Desulforhopalus sp.]